MLLDFDLPVEEGGRRRLGETMRFLSPPFNRATMKTGPAGHSGALTSSREVSAPGWTFSCSGERHCRQAVETAGPGKDDDPGQRIPVEQRRVPAPEGKSGQPGPGDGTGKEGARKGPELPKGPGEGRAYLGGRLVPGSLRTVSSRDSPESVYQALRLWGVCVGGAPSCFKESYLGEAEETAERKFSAMSTLAAPSVQPR